MGAWWLTAIGTLMTGFCYSVKRYTIWKGYQLPKRIAYYNDGIAYYFRTSVILLLLRSFIVEWSVIPSLSSAPTLLAGDRVITDKAAYGIRLPILGYVLIPLNQPQRGDMVVFRDPEATSTSVINRLIGLPGDKVQYRHQQLSINGKPLHQVEIGMSNPCDTGYDERWLLCEEQLEGHRYHIYKQAHHSETSYDNDVAIDIIVPKGHYFVMGDHRHPSVDSQLWRLLPNRLLLGKVKRVYLSRNKPTIWWKPHRWLRWSRIGMKIS